MSLTNALLGILARGPVHGYDLRQKFAAMLGGEWSISYGQLYPALSRLTRDGLVSKTPEPGDKASERNVSKSARTGSRSARLLRGRWPWPLFRNEQPASTRH